MEAYENYVELKDKHNKEMREIKKLQIKIENTGDEVIEFIREVSLSKQCHMAESS